MTDKQKPVFNSDKPLTDPTQDQFNRDKFAEMLAKSIVEMVPPEGLVIGLYGKWGTGKTTLLNFVRHYLEQYKKEQPIIIEFNPWWFSGEGNLTWHFLRHFSAQLIRWPDKVSKIVGKSIQKMADLVAIVPPHEYTSIPQKLVNFFFKREAPTMQELKDRVESDLARSNVRILFIIDDIDRLTADEIRELFRTMKAIANFPNVIYLVAFDDDVVAKALEDVQGKGISGREYLEKIVQVSFPVPHASNIIALLEEELDEIFADTDSKFWNRHSFKVIVNYVDLENLIRTPRDVRRLVNSLKLTYPALMGEVNPSHFLLIETLRVFRPKIYDMIRTNKWRFVETRFSLTYAAYTGKSFREGVHQFHKDWTDKHPDLKPLVKFLFPAIIEMDDPFRSTRGVDVGDLKINDPDRFDAYFSFALPPALASQDQIDRLVNLTSQPDDFKAELLRYDGDPRLKNLLHGISSRYRNIDKQAIPGVLHVLIDADRDFSEEWHLTGGRRDIIHRLLERVDVAEGLKLLTDAIGEIELVPYYADTILEYGVRRVFASEEKDELLKHPSYDKLKEFVLTAINKISQSNDWVNLFHSDMLNLWRLLTSKEEVQAWLHERFTHVNLKLFTDKELVEFTYMGVLEISSDGQHYYFRENWLLLDEEHMAAFEQRAKYARYDEDRIDGAVMNTFLNKYHSWKESLELSEESQDGRTTANPDTGQAKLFALDDTQESQD